MTVLYVTVIYVTVLTVLDVTAVFARHLRLDLDHTYICDRVIAMVESL